MKRVAMTLLLLLALVRAVPGADPVDGTNPPVQYGYKALSADQLAAGAVHLFDGCTFFGWDISAASTTRAANVADPEIVVKDGAMRIDATVPLRLRTPVLYTASGDEKTTAYFVIERADDLKAPVLCRLLDASGKTLAETVPMGTKTNPRKMTVGFSLKDKTPGATLEIYVASGKPVFESIVYCARGNVRTFSDGGAWKNPAGDMTLVPQANGFSLSGKGRLETKESFADFVCHFEFKSVVDTANRAATFCNSGFFFRCIPESGLDGYECQLNNVPNEADRAKFLGNDTGGIFRRAAARRVTDKDNEWTAVTVMAAGPVLRTWVNGIPVVVWRDTRKTDDNPRKGMRVAPGTIQLQGHDPWTKVDFRAFALYR